MNHIRHSGIFDASRLSVTLIGAGGIGAITALTLAKMGLGRLMIFDDDLVSEENLATQLHALSGVGTPKADALKSVLALFADDTVVTTVRRRVGPDTLLDDQIVISAVDSIAARQDIWAALGRGARADWYLDARMAAEEFHLWVVDCRDPQAVAAYDRRLAAEDDALVAELPCTSKATFYTAAIAAGQIGSAVRQIATAEKPRSIVHNIHKNVLLEV